MYSLVLSTITRENVKTRILTKRNNDKNVFLTIFLGSLVLNKRKVKSGELSILGVYEYIM